MTAPPPLPALPEQAATLVRLGVAAAAGLSADEFARAADDLVKVAGTAGDGALLAMDPARVPPSWLASRMRLPGHDDPAAKEGFVVDDLTDLDDFAAIESITLPSGPLYLVVDPRRGDEYANVSPNEALVELTARRRTPLLISEAVTWALQTPQVIAPNHCYMAIGSRIGKADGSLDSRTPAVWISGGTGRDGRARKGAPKVGWCWAGNRHTWLGIASAAGRVGELSRPAE